MLEVLLARSLAAYILAGIVIAVIIARQMLDQRDMVNKVLDPLDQIYSLAMTVMVWPVLLAEMIDQHKDGPWKG